MQNQVACLGGVDDVFCPQVLREARDDAFLLRVVVVLTVDQVLPIGNPIAARYALDDAHLIFERSNRRYIFGDYRTIYRPSRKTYAAGKGTVTTTRVSAHVNGMKDNISCTRRLSLPSLPNLVASRALCRVPTHGDGMPPGIEAFAREAVEYA